MKKIIIGLLILSILVLSGCYQAPDQATGQVVKVVCNKPYILVGSSCCLDTNDNRICDKDEIIEEPQEEGWKEQVKIEKVDQTEEKDIYFKLDSIDIIKNYHVEYDNTGFYTGFSTDKEVYHRLHLKGDLINNKNIRIKDLVLQVRFYNKKTKGQNIEFYDITDEKETMLTNLYANVNKNLLYQGTSKPFPANSKTSMDIIFDNIPSWRGDEDYIPKNPLKYVKWDKGSYNIDEAELILYHKDDKIQSEKIELPSPYKRDVLLDVEKIETSPGVYFHAININIKNQGRERVINPRIAFDITKLRYDGTQVQETDHRHIDIFPSTMVQTNSEARFRLSLEDVKPITFGSGYDKGYKIYVSLFDDKELLDKSIYDMLNYYHSNLTKTDDEIVDNVSVQQYGYKVEIEGIYGSSHPRGTGVKVRIQQPENYITRTKINNPVIDLFCKYSKIYELGEEIYSGYDEIIFIPFIWGNCEKMIVNLRSGDNPTIYAASKHSGTTSYFTLDEVEDE